MTEDFYHRTDCRVCGQSDFVKILDLGEMPPANAFLRKEDLNKPEQKFPLAVYFCKNCGLLQLLDVVNPEILFKNYKYLTSASKPLAEHFFEMAGELADKFIQSKNDLMVEIGGNDGSLLCAVKDRARVLNIEPAETAAQVSEENGVPTIKDFFSEELSERIVEEYGLARVVVANNAVAHIDDLKGLFQGIKNLIAEHGVFVFEVHWAGNLVNEGGFDQIYHEHLCYFSLLSLQELVSQFDLKIFDVELVPIHGQCLRVFVGKNFPVSASVSRFLEKERELGLGRAETFLQFRKKVENNKEELKKLLLKLKQEGKRIVGYGIPAKGNTLLNYCGIDGAILDYLTDTTSFKQGAYSPGTHMPIYSPDKLKEAKPDYILLLAWNYADFILEKEKDLRERGVKFIIPIPETKVI